MKTLIIAGLLLGSCTAVAGEYERLTETQINRLYYRQLDNCKYNVDLAIQVGKDIDDADWGTFCYNYVVTKVNTLVNQPVKEETNIYNNINIRNDVGVKVNNDYKFKIKRHGNSYSRSVGD